MDTAFLNWECESRHTRVGMNTVHDINIIGTWYWLLELHAVDIVKNSWGLIRKTNKQTTKKTSYV